MKYIESLREGERINEIYLCKVKQSALTKAGKPYDSLTLQDKTGTLDAKIWEPGSGGIDDFDSLDYIAVMGDITSFQGNLQLNVKRVRKAEEGEYDPKDYLPVSEKDIEQMYAELTGLIASVGEPHLRKLLESFFVEDADFQSRSVADPLRYVTADPDDDFSMIEGTLDHEQWDAFKPQLPAGRLTNIRYGQTYDDPRRMILVKQGISNGLMDILTFRRRGGNWKLVSYEN